MSLDSATQTLHEAARLAISEHRYADAVQTLERAIGRDPNDAWAHDALGISYQRLGRTEEALNEFRQSVEIAPHVAGFLYNLGAMLASVGELDEGQDTLLRCLEIDPEHARATTLLGRLQTDPPASGPIANA